MFDSEFKKYYQSAKDPSWPNVDDYKDFVMLDPRIKNECVAIRGLEKRINEIGQNNYWSSMCGYSVCLSGNLAFVPVQKCAYKYYTKKFTEQGWKKVNIKDIDTASTHFFGFMMHPLKRYMKGIAQMLVMSFARTTKFVSTDPWNSISDIDWINFEKALDSPYLHNLLNKISVGDEHAMPYYMLLGNLQDKVHWIPMDILSDNEMKLHAMSFCKLHGQDIALELNGQRIHESPPLQLKAYEIIKTIFLSSSEAQSHQYYTFYKIFGPDLKFYYELLLNFREKNINII